MLPTTAHASKVAKASTASHKKLASSKTWRAKQRAKERRQYGHAWLLLAVAWGGRIVRSTVFVDLHFAPNKQYLNTHEIETHVVYQEKG